MGEEIKLFCGPMGPMGLYKLAPLNTDNSNIRLTFIKWKTFLWKFSCRFTCSTVTQNSISLHILKMRNIIYVTSRGKIGLQTKAHYSFRENLNQTCFRSIIAKMMSFLVVIPLLFTFGWSFCGEKSLFDVHLYFPSLEGEQRWRNQEKITKLGSTSMVLQCTSLRFFSLNSFCKNQQNSVVVVKSIPPYKADMLSPMSLFAIAIWYRILK